MGRRRRRGRRTQGRGHRNSLLGPQSPGIWSPPPFIRTARRATSGWGRSVGSGIGDILSTGLKTVANRYKNCEINTQQRTTDGKVGTDYC